MTATIIGYARCSTDEQGLTAQRRILCGRRWPKEELVSLSEEWEVGPAPREDEGEFYLDENELTARYPDEWADDEEDE
ncbi:hypothetical protein [Nocardia brevicatena]|uniref:hypothetical protein n=1 Tax=Nocardia brevicatena TaxID=37327 RepID=UPI00030350B5|nr:hypothetical protein [Nocardia brevicatena]